MDGAANKEIVENVRGDGSSTKAELEEDFLRWLTEDERECLEYLLETIKALEEDLGEETTVDGARSEIISQDCPDVKQKGDSSSDVSRQTIHGKTQTASGKSDVAVDPTMQVPNEPKLNLPKSHSEGSMGETASTAQEGLNKLVNLHPGYLRKFDTIMRSGVNVQELRARFVTQHATASSLEEEAKTSEPSSPSKQALAFPGVHTSPREKALQKLGLLKRNQTNCSTTSSPEVLPNQAEVEEAGAPTTKHLHRDCQGSGSSSTTASGSSPLPSDDIHHQETFKKLRLLKL
ncbi:hypothetical protein NDU88_008459 [Pleurodeles waltl]|uniref:Uncharacterized protein n=1 Tax=Pleurodeles waltl TaxID=8319 RepID=A0AAV7N524_PLEWA|nr:hypothetical protein NDU88_008459 [Pleurodeles waltl]